MDQTLLIIDDERAVRDVIGALMEAEGYRVTMAADGQDALAVLEAHQAQPFDFILCDLKMPRVDGLEFLKRARSRDCPSTIIMMSGYGTVDTAVEAMKLGAYDYISKPFKPDEVVIALRKAAEREGLIRENRELRQTLSSSFQADNLVAKSSTMKAVLDLVRKVADYRSNVLIIGEPGTGKELLARVIHYNSKRKQCPFVTVNCGAIPPHLLEGELFGYEGGGGQDRPAVRRGLFEQAEGGTLFLDEICDLSAFLQMGVLKVLQSGGVCRVGGSREHPLDCRVIGASVRDLSKEVEEGRFREDLFYRLNVIPIRLPPLRDRRDDIPLLVDRFVRYYASELEKEVRAVTPEAMDALLYCPWRGNVRELENAIERAVVLADGPVVGLEHLAPWIQDDRRNAFLGVHPEEYSIKKVVPRIEQELIRRALRKTRGNRTAASKLLEISHRALLYKIKDFRIDAP